MWTLDCYESPLYRWGNWGLERESKLAKWQSGSSIHDLSCRALFSPQAGGWSPPGGKGCQSNRRPLLVWLRHGEVWGHPPAGWVAARGWHPGSGGKEWSKPSDPLKHLFWDLGTHSVMLEIEGSPTLKGWLARNTSSKSYKRQITTFVELEEKPDSLSNIYGSNLYLSIYLKF